MNKQLSKTMEKSKLRNRHFKYPSRENFLAYKKMKNKCINLLQQAKKKNVKNISNKGAATSKFIVPSRVRTIPLPFKGTTSF